MIRKPFLHYASVGVPATLILTGTALAMSCYVQYNTSCCAISGQGPSQSQPSGLWCGGSWCADLITANPPTTDSNAANSGQKDFDEAAVLVCAWRKSVCNVNACVPGGGAAMSANCHPYTTFGGPCTKGGGGGGT